VSGLNTLQSLNCSVNQISTLDLNGLTNLEALACQVNQLISLNLNGLTNLQNLDCSSNQLNTLFLKNSSLELYLVFSGNPNLQYLCADANQIGQVRSKITEYGYSNCHVNTYCSFTPGGGFYTILGTSQYDSNGNGCDINDLINSNLKLSFTDGTNTGDLIPNNTGNYRFDVQAGTHVVTPTIENPAYFAISPTTATVAFPTATSPFTQNFCITANGVHNDLEVSIIPLVNARPGFDADYQIIYKNKGTSFQSGTVELSYNNAVATYVSAIPAVTSQTTSSLNWSFTALQPFETRIIDVVLLLNTPTATPPLNGGDILNYTATVSGLIDETPTDNVATLAQSVVNSFDPNDKTCAEGSTVSPSMVGKYVHYVVRFENTGTANAQNIVVKDVIDTTKFDISTLVPLTGSAEFTTKITNTNQVEFIFENINLPFDDANNDGYVAFKIKTKPTLVLGDTFSNSASIYFDYNFPIITNTATTTIQTLDTQDFTFTNYFGVYPIPAKRILNIENKGSINVKKINIYDILGQIVLTISNPESVSTIDVSNLKTGTYFIKVVTDIGTANRKFLKE
jgi:Leucine-rich repeat (LRR) protein